MHDGARHNRLDALESCWQFLVSVFRAHCRALVNRIRIRMYASPLRLSFPVLGREQQILCGHHGAPGDQDAGKSDAPVGLADT